MAKLEVKRAIKDWQHSFNCQACDESIQVVGDVPPGFYEYDCPNCNQTFEVEAIPTVYYVNQR